MRKVLSILLLLILGLGLFVGCGQKAEPLNLNGEWQSEDFKAVIENDYITIEWNNEDTQTTALYWAGSVDVPKDIMSNEEYKWTSKNDTEKTSSAILASPAETKDFTYKDGKITFEYSAMGVDSTANLTKVEK